MKGPPEKGIIKKMSRGSQSSQSFSYYHPWNALSEMGYYSLNTQRWKRIWSHQTFSELDVCSLIVSPTPIFPPQWTVTFWLNSWQLLLSASHLITKVFLQNRKFYLNCFALQWLWTSEGSLTGLIAGIKKESFFSRRWWLLFKRKSPKLNE